MNTKFISRAAKSLPFAVLVTALACGNSIAASPLDDSQILGIYIQVNSFDIEAALLGRAQGGSEAVRNLAEHVAKDHTGVRQAAYDLAVTCKVSPVLPEARNAAAVEHGASMLKFLSLKGVEFDKAYAQHEVEFHRAAIAAVRTALLPAAKCPALVAHFKEVLPAFEHHLAAIEGVAKDLSMH